MSAHEPKGRPRRMIVGITGATGIIYGIRALKVLREVGIETHLVVSRAGEMTRAYETGLSREALHALAPSELSWELELEIEEPQAPGARLDGGSPLGLMSWAAPRGRTGVVRADARIRN